MKRHDLEQKIEEAAKILQELCIEHELKVATAESLTGGLISSSIVKIPGSSAYFDRGFVVYNNTAKHDMLGVHNDIFKKYTEVSGECVEAMARGAIDHSFARVSCAVSGIAGPDGGTDENPVGTVWIAVAHMPSPLSCLKSVFSKRFVFEGDRLDIRLQTVLTALTMMIFSVQAGFGGQA